MRIASRSAGALASWGSVALSVGLWLTLHPGLGIIAAMITGLGYSLLVDIPTFAKLTKSGKEWEENGLRRGCAVRIVLLALTFAVLGSLAAVGAAHLTGLMIIVPIGVCYAVHVGAMTGSVFALGLLRRR